MPGSPWSAQSSPGPSLGWISWSGSCLSSGGRASPGPQHQDQAVKFLPVSPVLCTRAASTAPKISPKSQGFPHAGSESVLVVLLFPGTGRARKTQRNGRDVAGAPSYLSSLPFHWFYVELIPFSCSGHQEIMI